MGSRRRAILSRGLAVALAAAAAVGALGAGGLAHGFHFGGVGECAGCHTMHNSLGGERMTVNDLPAGTANPYLLRGSDASSTCLVCHHTTATTPQTYHVSSPRTGGPPMPSQMTPGGDFGWGAAGPSGQPPIYQRAHSIVAADFGYGPDTTLTRAPGGTYSRDDLSCVSCHDPHGRYRHLPGTGEQALTGAPIRESGSYGAEPDAASAVGVYRLLGGVGYRPRAVAGELAFAGAAPVAVSPEDYNRAESESDTRVAYGLGMSEWCQNCHGLMHSDDYPGYPGNFRHPAGNHAKLGARIAANYNRYDLRTGAVDADGSQAYTSLVPFERGTADRAELLAATESTAGPTTGSENVACVSCHRAHASAFADLGRWNFNAVLLTQPGFFAKYYYDRPASYFGPFQRSLCSKCHVRD
ncbi:MAG: hypothetical protein SCH98_18035 [Deferrisomatales bacterium]|nr:hypothetical protein [Deferrisomatales bacterium]